MPIKNAICFMCVNVEQIIIDFAKTIIRSVPGITYDIFIIVDNNNISTPVCNGITFIQVDETECAALGFDNSNFMVGKHPSAWDKVFYWFSTKPDGILYDNIWIIEEDVFVPTATTIAHVDLKYMSEDLLSSSNIINEMGDTSTWFWNRAKELFDVPWYSSMVCACRVSRKLVEHIHIYATKHKSLCFI